MLAVRGACSKIASELEKLLPPGEHVLPVARDEKMPDYAWRYLFCQGVMHQKKISEVGWAELYESFYDNAVLTIRECERIIEINPIARICVIGSESGFSWSYDGAYAASKAALHRYVETKRLSDPRQQLLCIAPSIIEDCGMTTRREDKGNLILLRAKHPKGRFLTAAEVARAIYFALYVDNGYMSGTVIRMHGGPR